MYNLFLIKTTIQQKTYKQIITTLVRDDAIQHKKSYTPTNFSIHKFISSQTDKPINSKQLTFFHPINSTTHKPINP